MIAKVKYIVDNKKITSILPTQRYVDPKYVYIATNNARCDKSELYIKEGDHVNCFQVIGMRYAKNFVQPIHATVSGTFVGLEKHYHRNGKLIDFIKIENDFKDTFDSSVKERSNEEIKKLTKDDMTNIIKDCALVGLGGSSFPTYIKFQTKEKINVILINAIECEPYITSDQRIMMESPHRIIQGIQYALQAFDCHQAYICIKSKYKQIKQVYDLLLKPYPEIKIKTVGNFYPQGWEKAMIKSALNIELNENELPMQKGIMNFNVSTIVGLYKAIKYNIPVVKRNITVTGEGIMYPKNFRVRVGTPVKELIELCGGYSHPELNKVIILGGPMMGASLPSDDCIITKTVTSVIVLNDHQYKEEPCIRCGSCVMSCPTHLQPVMIMNAVKTKDKERIKTLNPLKCIECGLCTYSCTSKIHVLDYVRKAKIFAKL